MATAGLVLDTWKVPVFKRMLNDAGYSYIVNKGLTPETSLIQITTDDMIALQEVLEEAALACNRMKFGRNYGDLH